MPSPEAHAAPGALDCCHFSGDIFVCLEGTYDLILVVQRSLMDQSTCKGC